MPSPLLVAARKWHPARNVGAAANGAVTTLRAGSGAVPVTCCRIQPRASDAPPLAGRATTRTKERTRTDDLKVRRGPVRCERSQRQRVVTDRTRLVMFRLRGRKTEKGQSVHCGSAKLEREGASVKPPVDVPLQGATQNLNDIRTLPFQVTVSKFFRKHRNTPPVPSQPHHVPDHRFGYSKRPIQSWKRCRTRRTM